MLQELQREREKEYVFLCKYIYTQIYIYIYSCLPTVSLHNELYVHWYVSHCYPLWFPKSWTHTTILVTIFSCLNPILEIHLESCKCLRMKKSSLDHFITLILTYLSSGSKEIQNFCMPAVRNSEKVHFCLSERITTFCLRYYLLSSKWQELLDVTSNNLSWCQIIFFSADESCYSSPRCFCVIKEIIQLILQLFSMANWYNSWSWNVITII